DGRQSIKDDPRSGRPSTSRNDDVVANIYEKVRNDRRLTVRELANEAGVSIGSCHEILTDEKGNETWAYGYDPETKLQSSQWKTKFFPRPKKARQVRSNVKTMLIVFFDIEGIVHYEFVPHGQTVNQVFYKDVLIRFRERIREKRPEKWRS
ncbi:Transposase, type 1,Winged helix-turn-helix DNA-binding domain, partial [Cinara cedri]